MYIVDIISIIIVIIAHTFTVADVRAAGVVITVVLAAVGAVIL